MHDYTILFTFAGGLIAALICGYIATRLKLAAIVGYLVAGIAIGPFTPGFIGDQVVAENFAEIGVILLLFGVGLHFNLRELLAVWKIAIPGALVQSSMSSLAMAGILHFVFDWDFAHGIVLGLSISVASTVVMALVLNSRGDLHAPIGYIAIGWTVVEDLITVTLLLLLPIIFGGGAQQDAGTALGLTALKVVALGATIVVLARWVIPWVMNQVDRTRSNELFTLSILLLGLGIAVASSEIFGVSMALGAFLAGLAVGRSEFAGRAYNDSLPTRDAFTALFFVSMGMLFDPASLIEEPLLILAVIFVVVVVKPFAGALVVRLSGRPNTTAIPVGAALSQIGEFTFILAVAARSLGILDEAGWNAIVATSIITIALNPTIYRLARNFVTSAAELAASEEKLPVNPKRCVLVGYGPVGRTVHKILSDFGEEVTVVELNLETVRGLREGGHTAVYGDVLRAGTLAEAGIATAGSMILSVEIESAAQIISQVKGLNPEIRVLARCSDLRQVPALRHAGATVVAGEAEVAVALAEALMEGIGTDRTKLSELRSGIRNRLYEAA